MSSDQNEARDELLRVMAEANGGGVPAVLLDAVIANPETVVKAAGWRAVAGEYHHDRDVKRVTYEMPAQTRKAEQ